MSLKDKWLKKTKLKEKTIKIDGGEITIKELSGLERLEMGKIDDGIDGQYYIWQHCILTKEETMTKEEFMQVYDLNHAIIEYILGAVFEFSGLTSESEEELSKN